MTDSKAFDAAIEKRQAEVKQKFLEILREAPIIEFACKKCGIGRTTYYRWRSEDPVFASQSAEALQQGIEYMNDLSESQLITLMKEKKMPAIAMWLKHNSPRYRRQPVAPLQPNPIPGIIATIRRLNAEDEKYKKDEE